jgi:hypothetical protein
VQTRPGVVTAEIAGDAANPGNSQHRPSARKHGRRQVPGVQETGFFKRWLDILWNEDQEWSPENLGSDEISRQEFNRFHETSRPPFTPDMYYIDAAERMIYFYEIEDSHPLSENKLGKMEFWMLSHGDDGGWHGRVIVTDRYGLNHRMILAYEHSYGPEPVSDDEIEHKFPKVYKPLALR